MHPIFGCINGHTKEDMITASIAGSPKDSTNAPREQMQETLLLGLFQKFNNEVFVMSSSTSGFEINANKGFSITFANKYRVSVQFSAINYCANYNPSLSIEKSMKSVNGEITTVEPVHQCPDAEIAVFNSKGDFISFKSSKDNVLPNTTPDMLLKILTWASSQP